MSVEVDVLHQPLVVQLVLALVREGKLHLCPGPNTGKRQTQGDFLTGPPLLSAKMKNKGYLR